MAWASSRSCLSLGPRDRSGLNGVCQRASDPGIRLSFYDLAKPLERLPHALPLSNAGLCDVTLPFAGIRGSVLHQ